MAKKTINLGTGELTGDGESIRSAFGKINENFDELYAQDAAGIDLSAVGQNIIPDADNARDLGSADKQWRSLYVSSDTIFIGGVSLKIDGDNRLIIGDDSTVLGGAVSYNDLTDKPSIPADISDLTDTTNLLSSGTGDITFTNSTISAPNQDEIVIQSKDSNGFGTARVTLNSEYGGNARLRAFSNESVDTFTLANGDFATGVWQDNGFGNGVVAFTGAQSIGDFFQNTLFKLTADNVTISINGGTLFVWNGGASGAGTDTPGFGTNPIVPETPVTITSIEFRYRSESFISVNYDNQEIRLNAQNAGIRMDSDNTFQVFGDSRIELQSAEGMSLSAGEDIDIGTNSSFATRISTGDFTVNAFDDIRIEGRDSFRLINSSATAPIRIITNDDDIPRTWAFNPDGTVTFPDATVQTTAYTGPQTSLTGDVKGSVFADDSTLLVDAVSGSIPYSVLSGAPTVPVNINDLGDVALTDPVNGDLLTYFNGTWTNAALLNYVSVGDNVSVLNNDAGYLTAIPTTLTASLVTSPGGEVTLKSEHSANINSSFYIYSDEFGAAAYANVTTDNFGSKNWRFSETGNLTIPGNIESEDAVEIRVNLTDSTTHTWRFGEDGHLNLPSGGGNIQSDGAIQLITGSSTFTVTDDVFGFLNNKNGTIALSLVSGGVSIAGSGNFAFSGNAFAATTTNDINLTSGSGITLNSPVTEVRGNNLILAGDNVDIQSEGGVNIDINLSDSTLRRWRFGEDGILNLPEGGDIVDSTGTSVLGGGGSGSVLEEPFESKTSATGVIEHDATTNRLFYHTSISANFTANFTNLGLAANEATSISLVLVQGATARMVTAVQIGGAAQTITWQGSASAPSGNANRTDVVTFSILCTATDTYTVLGMLTSFGG